jgi:hypothetical protein
MKIYKTKKITFMKKTFFVFLLLFVLLGVSFAQDNNTALQPLVKRIEQATTVKDYSQLATEFGTLAEQQQNNWLSWYYAAFCNAKVGWLYFDDGEKIEPFANKADEQIKKAYALLDTSKQKTELSEVYVVLSMVNRAKVYINPMTYGRTYGIPAGRYTQSARRTNPDNPRALYIEGWEKYATPKLYGGDKKIAKELLTQAKQKLNNGQAAGANPNWGIKETEELLAKLK